MALARDEFGEAKFKISVTEDRELREKMRQVEAVLRQSLESIDAIGTGGGRTPGGDATGGLRSIELFNQAVEDATLRFSTIAGAIEKFFTSAEGGFAKLRLVTGQWVESLAIGLGFMKDFNAEVEITNKLMDRLNREASEKEVARSFSRQNDALREQLQLLKDQLSLGRGDIGVREFETNRAEASGVADVSGRAETAVQIRAAKAALDRFNDAERRSVELAAKLVREYVQQRSDIVRIGRLTDERVQRLREETLIIQGTLMATDLIKDSLERAATIERDRALSARSTADARKAEADNWERIKSAEGSDSAGGALDKVRREFILLNIKQAGLTLDRQAFDIFAKRNALSRSERERLKSRLGLSEEAAAAIRPTGSFLSSEFTTSGAGGFAAASPADTKRLQQEEERTKNSSEQLAVLKDIKKRVGVGAG